MYSHKTKPTFAMSKEEEYNPEKPCKPCFPFSNSKTEAFENLGTRNLVIKFTFKNLILSLLSKELSL